MKKIIGLAIVIAAYVAAAFYTGYLGEQKTRQQFALAEAQTAEQGLSLVLNSYDRGIFFSDVDVTATTTNVAFPSGALVISSKSRIQHGPVLFSGGLGVGLFSSSSTLTIRTGNAEIDQSLIDIFGPSIGEIVTRAGFDNRYLATWTIPQITRSEAGEEFSLASATLSVTGAFNNSDVKGEFNLGAIHSKSIDGAELNISPLVGNYEVSEIADDLYLMNMNASLEKMSGQDASTLTNVLVEQVKITQQQALVNDKINTRITLDIENISGPLEISAIHYDVQLNQLSKAFVQEWTKFSQTAQMSATDTSMQQDEMLDRLMMLALQDGLALSLKAGAEFMGGTTALDLNAHYVPLPDNKMISTIENPSDYFLLVRGDMVFDISESIINQSPLMLMIGPYLDNYIIQENGKYIVKATLKDGKVTVGKMEMPAEMVWTMLSLFAMPKPVDEGEQESPLDEPVYN